MRTDAELKEAVRHISEAQQGTGLDQINPMDFYALLDILAWAQGEKDTLFERLVIEPCRAIDRANTAAKAAEN